MLQQLAGDNFWLPYRPDLSFSPQLLSRHLGTSTRLIPWRIIQCIESVQEFEACCHSDMLALDSISWIAALDHAPTP
jgi:hypothetical protein